MQLIRPSLMYCYYVVGSIKVKLHHIALICSCACVCVCARIPGDGKKTDQAITGQRYLVHYVTWSIRPDKGVGGLGGGGGREF